MKVKCPKCKGKGCSHCGGTGYHNNMNKGGVAKSPRQQAAIAVSMKKKGKKPKGK